MKRMKIVDVVVLSNVPLGAAILVLVIASFHLGNVSNKGHKLDTRTNYAAWILSDFCFS